MLRPAADDVTGETVVLEVQTAPETFWALLDPGPWTRLLGFSYWAPWRALAIGAAAVVLALAARSNLVLAGALLATIALGVSEVLHRRDFVTTRYIVRQSGIIGRHRAVFPVGDVEEVRVSYHDDARTFRGGDVEVRGQGWGVTLQCVASPQAVADAILRARDEGRTAGGARGAAEQGDEADER